MERTDTSPHWAAWIVVHLGRLIMAILIFSIAMLFMAAKIAISIGKGGK